MLKFPGYKLSLTSTIKFQETLCHPLCIVQISYFIKYDYHSKYPEKAA